MPRTEEFTEPTMVFTDDKAPVEQVVHGLILSFVAGRVMPMRPPTLASARFIRARGRRALDGHR